MLKKITAGITTKNEEWIIEKTLHSLEKYCERVIVYDDGSTDNTEKICRSFDIVNWYTRPIHDPFVREEAKQRLELLQILRKYNPEYVLLLDADEIPTPSIVNFIDNIDESVGVWCSRMINLWEDETKYRTDLQWNPFLKNAWAKYPLMKYDETINYTYNLLTQKGGCSKYHPAPNNPSMPVKEQEEFYVIHYGKLATDYLNGDRHKFYARIEEKWGQGSYESRLLHHQNANQIHTLETKPTKEEWFWGT